MRALSVLRGHPYARLGTATIPMILLLLLSLMSDTTLAAPHYRHHPQQQVAGDHHALRQDSGNGGQHLGPTTTIAIVVDGASLTTGIASPVVSGVNGNGSIEIETGIEKAAAQDDLPSTSASGRGGAGNTFAIASPAPISSFTKPVSPASSGSQQNTENNGPPGRHPSPVVFFIDGDDGEFQQNTISFATQDNIVSAAVPAQSNINTGSELPPLGSDLVDAGGQKAQQQDQQFVSSPILGSPSSPPVTAVVVDQLSPETPLSVISTISQPSEPAILSTSAPPLEEELAPSTTTISTTPFISLTSPSTDDPTLITHQFTPPPSPIPPTTPSLAAQETRSLPPLAITDQILTPSETITKTLSIRLTTIATTITHLVTVTETLTPSTSSSIPPSTASPADLANGAFFNNGTSPGENSTISSGGVSIEALLTSSMSSSSGTTFLTNTRNGTLATTATGVGSGYAEHYLYRQQYRPLTAS